MWSLVKRAELAWQNLAYRRWQKKNPGASFKQYFADGIKDRLEDGKTRASLGATLKGDGFGELAKRNFQRLLQTYRIQPRDVCVDYGCGTLRMGVHLIKYLQPGHYTGLDIDQSLIDQGAKLIGAEMLAAKGPKLAVISPASVAAAAARHPTFLFSLKVLIHVHPDELDEYLSNIVTIVGGTGRAVVTGKWSPGETYQTGKKSWAHGLSVLEAVVAKHGGALFVTGEEDYVFEGLGKTGRSGRLEIVRNASA